MEIADLCQSLQDDKLASGALNQVNDNNLFGVSETAEHCHFKVKQSNVIIEFIVPVTTYQMLLVRLL